MMPIFWLRHASSPRMPFFCDLAHTQTSNVKMVKSDKAALWLNGVMLGLAGV
jgi:hypothetical protein